MVEVGNLQIGGSIQTAEIERGLGRVEKGFKKVEGVGKGVNADLIRMNQSAGRLAKTLGMMAVAGAGAIIGLAKGAPALAGAMAKIKVSMMKLKFAIGDALKPQFDWFANKLNSVVGWVEANPDLFGKITTSVLVLGGAFLAFKVGGAIAVGISSLLGVAGALVALVTSPTFLAVVAALGVAAAMWGYVNKLGAESEAYNALVPPGMKDIEYQFPYQERGTRQFETVYGPENPFHIANIAWNFGEERTNIRNMTLGWDDRT